MCKPLSVCIAFFSEPIADRVPDGLKVVLEKVAIVIQQVPSKGKCRQSGKPLQGLVYYP